MKSDRRSLDTTDMSWIPCDEIEAPYVGGDDRFIVSLVLGFPEERARSVEEAVERVVDDVRGACPIASAPYWSVFDRATGKRHMLQASKAIGPSHPAS